MTYRVAMQGFHPLAKDCHIKTPTDPLKTLYELPPAGFLQVPTTTERWN